MDNLQKIVFQLVNTGNLSMNSNDGKIDLLKLLEEAVAKKMLPGEVLELINNIVKGEG